jgi:glucose/mannose-6-phosphate isomerase
MDLDAPDRFAEVDPADALHDVEATAAQWAAARDLATVRADVRGVTSVVVLGMGGSGITGDVVAAMAQPLLPVPVVVHKTYGLPGFVGPTTLVVACSYSGDTEETASAVDAALERGARMVAISSGGRLGALCEERGIPWVRLPGGRQPRHSLGYLAVPALMALGLEEGIDEAITLLSTLAGEWGRGVPTASNPAKQLARRLRPDSVPVLYGAAGLPALAAYRFKCQLNENTELLALSGVLPELDHNEVVGWQHPSALTPGGLLVWLRDLPGEHHRVALRVEATRRLIGDRAGEHVEVTSRGELPLARLASLLLFADLVSVYAAIAMDRDPTAIAPISALKAELAG